MNEPTNGAPSSARIWKATAAAIVIAALFLFIVLRPAQQTSAPAPPAQQADAPAAADGTSAAEQPASEALSAEDELAALMQGNIRAAEPGVQKSYDSSFKSEVFQIAMAPLEEVEFKAHMQPGDALVYSWTSPQPVYVDMHGEPYTYPEEPAVRYEELDGVTSGHGRVTATFPGMNGWFWLNTSEEPIVIELRASGFYEKFEEVYRKAP